MLNPLKSGAGECRLFNLTVNNHSSHPSKISKTSIFSALSVALRGKRGKQGKQGRQKICFYDKKGIFAGNISSFMNHNIVEKIRDYLKSKPIDKAWIFGSFSRGEETGQSDIDILVEFTPKKE